MNLGEEKDNTVIINILYDHGKLKKRSQKAGNKLVSRSYFSNISVTLNLLVFFLPSNRVG